MALKVLAIGRQNRALKRLERALKLKKYKVTGCTSDDDALKKIKSQKFDALLLPSEMELESKAIFKQFTREQRPGMPIVEINGSVDRVASDIEAAMQDH
jgi:DNA-binding NtrC family response regulator